MTVEIDLDDRRLQLFQKIKKIISLAAKYLNNSFPERVLWSRIMMSE
jgi:hypothetical protein